jgi:PIN domain nuclease of toxin-antitoxin system
LRLLLDTHALIWALSGPRHLPALVKARVSDPDSQVWVSAVSTWEIAIKSALGKITVDIGVLAEAIPEAGFEELRVSIAHTLCVRTLPAHHRDPFDRLLIAQAIEEGLTVVTHDPAFARYPAPTLWA